MTTTFDSRTILRGVLALTIVGGAALAAGGCGSDSPETASAGGGGVDAGLFPGTAGYFGAGGIGSGTGGFPGGGVPGGGGLPGFAGAGGIGVAGSGAGGGTAGGGGVAGASGSSGAAGSSSGGAGDGAVACVVPTTLLDVSKLPDCAVPSLKDCLNGKCLPTSVVPAASQALLAKCDATSMCVPIYMAARLGKFIPPTCTSLKNAEGRCLSQCVPQIAAQETFLPKGSCDTGDLCAPCYDPRTGADTGACTQGCDTGPTKPAVTFDKCCSNTGICVPSSAVPTAQQSLLGKDTCTTAGELCAPTKLTDSSFIPKTCKSLLGAEGRCTADCIPSVAAQAGRLPTAGCDTHEVCAPCFDPLTGLSTGACNQNGDTPASTTPVTFPTCCGTSPALGHCVPSTILATDQQTLLGKDTCSTTGDLCAPDIFAVSGATIDVCRALGSLNAEGRCIPSCVPSIQAQKDRLDQGTPKTCADGTLCAPCYDPVTGADTGACSQNGDKPKEVKKVFPACCSGLGVCVTPTLVPSAQQSLLDADTCNSTQAAPLLCAPKALTDPTAKPKTCTAPGGFEARCLPACLPPIKAQAANLRQTSVCAAGELCADCYNPIDGTDTGACTINGDTPAQTKKVFATCGSGRGMCVPKDLVPTTLQSMIPVDTCTGPDSPFCAPAEKVKDITFKFPTCDPQIPPFPPDTVNHGACLPKYIIDFQAKTNTSAGLLAQSNCKTGEICAPCKDPLSGKNTGACD